MALAPGGAEFSRAMSKVREAVERGYKDIKQLLSLNDFPRQMKALKSPIGLMTIASAGIACIRCCLCQSHDIDIGSIEWSDQTGRCFDCVAPSSEEYLRFEVELEE